VQEKLLRVVEYGQFQRLGGEDTITTDVRIVAATNVDLPGRAAEGRFRPDLLDRLAFDVITLAPLRARPEDIILLAEHFGQRIARALRDIASGLATQGALGSALAMPVTGYSIVYHVEMLLLFVTLVAIGPLVGRSSATPTVPRKFGLADLPG